MGTVQYQDSIAFKNEYNPRVQAVLARQPDWIGFLDALGKVEGADRYNAQNAKGYIGIYQFAPFSDENSIFKDLDFSNNIGGMLGATTDAAYKANPIAQELSALMEFSGIPHITKTFYSKYTYVRNAAPWAGLSKSNFDAMIGLTVKIQWKNGNQNVGEVQEITLTKAGISAAAHLVGQGGVALVMRKIYDQTHTAWGGPLPTVNLDISGGYVGTQHVYFADGAGIAFSTYVQLYQGFDISPLTDAPDDWGYFNEFARQLISYRKDKIISDMISKRQEAAMSVSYNNRDYRETIRQIILGLELPTDNLSAVDGQVVLVGAANTKYTDKADLIYGLGDVDNVLTGGKGNDTLCGGGGDDLLSGGEGNDVMNGDEGNDVFIGGQGNDVMYGGADNDVYFIRFGDGNDTIEDKEGINTVILCYREIKFFYDTGDGETYKSYDGSLTLEKSTGKLTDAQNSIIVTLNQNFQEGDFGIDLIDLPADIPALPDPEISNTIVGDLAPVDMDPETEGVQYGYDQWGNVITDPDQPESGRNDVLYDTTASDKIEGLAGNDTITISRGSSSGDWVDGGSGNDDIYTTAENLNAHIYGGDGDDFIFTDSNGSGWLYGGEGGDIIDGERLNNCIIEGGPDSDILIGGINGNNKLFGDSFGEMADLIAAGDTAPDSGVRGDIVAADGENSNFLYGLLLLPHFSEATVVI